MWISFAGKSCDLDHDFHCMRDFTVTAAGRNRSVNFTPSMFYRRLTSCYTHTDSAGLLVTAPLSVNKWVHGVTAVEQWEYTPVQHETC